jgi:hypothetical protein
MNFELTQHTRLALLSAVLGLAVLGSGLILIGRFHGSSGSTDSAAPAPVVPTPVLTPAPAATATAHAWPRLTNPRVHAVTTPQTHVVPKAPVHGAAPQVVHRPLAADGLPALPRKIARALAQHRVVVVFLTAPNVKLDHQALLEAQAGARDAHAAFAAVDVTGPQVDPLTARYSVLHDPAVLVLKPPAELAIKLDGFADRATVAQAATSARP